MSNQSFPQFVLRGIIIPLRDILPETTLSAFIGSEGKVSACNAGDPGSIPGLERSPGEGNDTHSSILAWRIPWTEEPNGLQSMGSQSWTQLSD